MKKIKKLVLLLICIIIMLVIIKNGELLSISIKKGLNISINSLFPSLFPFIVISSFFVLSNSYIYLSKIIYPFVKNFFLVPKSIVSIIFISFIGGFPVGAKNISLLLDEKKINKKTAEVLISFCINAGPAFIITCIGEKFFENKFIGIILFFSQIIASILVCSIFTKCFLKNEKITNKITINKISLSESFTKSVDIAINSMVSISSFVIVFVVIIEFINTLNIENNIIKSIIYSFIEVTYATNYIIKSNTNIVFSIYLVNFALSLCGLCVIFQIKSILSKHNVSLKYFFVSRILHIFISSICIFTLLVFFPLSQNVFSPSDIVVISVSQTSIFSFIFLVFSIFCIYLKIYNLINKNQ